MSESSSRGENFPEQQFPRLSLLPLSGARVLVFPPGDGQGRAGWGWEGRDTSLSFLRPLLPRHRLSPNWRGTGFSTVFRLHNPSAADQ